MTKTILVPLDGSAQSDEALRFAVEEFPDVKLVLLHVINPVDSGYTTPINLPGAGQEWYEAEKAAAEELFEKARTEAEAAGVAVETVSELGNPAKVIVKRADEPEIDGIVMGSHGRSGVSRILLGSVAEAVVRRSPVPVTVVR